MQIHIGGVESFVSLKDNNIAIYSVEVFYIALLFINYILFAFLSFEINLEINYAR